MLAHEPALQLVGADDIADEKIIGTIVAAVSGFARQRACLDEDRLVCTAQLIELRFHGLATAWYSPDSALGRGVERERQRDATERLHTLCNRVGQLGLLPVVFVEEQMKLVERRAGSLPVVLLVQISQAQRVSEHSVQRRNALVANF